MVKFVRILFAAFIAASIAYTANATPMAIKMVLTDSGTVDMVDCTGCDEGSYDDDSQLVCNFECLAPFVADLGTQHDIGLPVAVSSAVPNGTCGLIGRIGPPEPYPPRTLI